jgi:hypothetical protein
MARRQFGRDAGHSRLAGVADWAWPGRLRFLGCSKNSRKSDPASGRANHSICSAPNGQRVPRFHSGMFTTDLRTAPGFYRGEGFVFEKREGEYPGAREASQRGLLHQPRSLAVEESHDVEVMIDALAIGSAISASRLSTGANISNCFITSAFSSSMGVSSLHRTGLFGSPASFAADNRACRYGAIFSPMFTAFKKLASINSGLRLICFNCIART